MADEWDKYAVKTDEWEQYASSEQPSATETPESAMQKYMSQTMPVGLGLVGAGIASKVIPPAVNMAKMVPTAASTPKSANFARDVRSAFVNAHTEQVNKFANSIDELSKANPDRLVDLSGVIGDIQNNWDDMSPETRSIIKKTPVLNKLVSDLWDKKAIPTATEVSLKDAQNISNFINTKLPKNIKYNNLDIMDTLNSVRGAQLEAFPEMEAVRAEYKPFIQAYNNVKQYFKFNKLLSSVESKFGGAEGQEAVEQILPKSVIKKLGGYRRANELVKLAKNPLGIVGKMLGTAHGFALGTIDPAFAVYRGETGLDPIQAIEMMRRGGMNEEEKRKFLESQVI